MAGNLTFGNNFRVYAWDEDAKCQVDDIIKHIVSTGDIGGEAEEQDVTTLYSLVKETEYGQIDEGSFDLTLNLIDEQYAYFKARRDNGDDINFGVAYWNKKKEQIVGLHFMGKVSKCVLAGASVSGLLQVNTTIKINSAIDQGFVDPAGGVIGKPVEKIEVLGASGKEGIDTKGGTLQIAWIITPTDATNPAVKFSVDKETVATITSTGKLKAVSDGTVEVTVSARDGSGVTGKKSFTITNQSED